MSQSNHNPAHNPITRLATFFGGPWIGRSNIDRLFDEQRERAPQRLRIHAAVAAVCVAGIAGPMSVAEVSFFVLLGFLVLRVLWTRRLWIHSVGQPVFLMLLVWAAWQALSLAWSRDPRTGLQELSDLRFALLIPALWPIIESRRLVIAALCTGFLLGNLMQFVEVIFQGREWLPFTHMPNRFPGWWGAATAGSLLTAALGLHLPAAILGRGRTRLIGCSLALMTALGLLATGSRGGWIASTVLIVINLSLGLVSGMRDQPRRIIGVCIFLGLVALVAGLALRGPITSRVIEARDEIRGALDRNEFTSPTGARIAMGVWGLRAFAAHPIEGVGAGGYRTWVMNEIEHQGLDPDKYSIHDSAHSTPIHIAATGGLVGITLTLLLIAFIGWAAWHSVPPESRGTYAAGPACALLGLVLVCAFDTIHLSSRTGALIGVLLALCPAYLPPRARA